MYIYRYTYPRKVNKMLLLTLEYANRVDGKNHISAKTET